jgi:hypothetical protein
MAKTLAELLEDAASGDDLAFTGPDGVSIKLGDIRGFGKSASDSNRIAAMKLKQAEEAASEAQNILLSLKDAAKKMNDKPSGGRDEGTGDDWRKDLLYAPIIPVFDALAKQAKEALETSNALKAELARTSSFYMIERMRAEYNAAPESYRKAVSFDEAVKSALTNGDMDSYGEGQSALRMPTLRKRIHEGTEADRLSAAVKTAVDAAKVEWDKTQKAAAVPKPTGAFRATVKKTEGPIKKLDELTSDLIANDPDIIAAMEGTAN